MTRLFNANVTNRNGIRFEILKLSGCSDGWDFDNSIFQSTVATTFNWFCDDEIYSRHVITARWASGAIGYILFPVIADR